MALGARPQDIVRAVLTRGVRTVLVGVGLGTGMALALGRLLRGFLYGVSPFDAVTFGGWGVALVILAIVAAYVPARRIGRIDPAAALSGRS
jgi:ABC-type antimicrobial peptide transport system permease subunit